MDEQEKVQMPGCGLGAYAILLGFVGLLGVGGLVVSSYSLVVMTGEPIAPLVPGTQVPVWRLQPLRDAGVLQLTETPAAFHDESLDGTVVCVLMNEELVRLERGTVTRLVYEDIETVEMEGSEKDGGAVTSKTADGREVGCRFRGDEGMSRFARQLKTEAGISEP
jgi:hypothetical protein